MCLSLGTAFLCVGHLCGPPPIGLQGRLLLGTFPWQEKQIFGPLRPAAANHSGLPLFDDETAHHFASLLPRHFAVSLHLNWPKASQSLVAAATFPVSKQCSRTLS